ncbi:MULTISPECIES: DUF2839 domain-containing protein [Prochlorococcus]|uniref:Uncharacterized membrane protein n=2 Tax=Prochlorococcus marinus TaxID=1219 RepID=Q7V9V7_PROMA|nr:MULTISPECIES: DUF2839 domain-containing protein [Prochlorococcus]AAQ00761.1 Uncharacterized membrane protein [Prochlorococcus marinus subsp. marinus str. CCMP1375]KGG10743.1 hypothetical protein EV04_1704 [Prochlorococcus marinus str. LG]KGG21166.1 hypothetical protein EV08_0882 [Prochlorococcus marinus str. SS2]KGG23990.1 hypothetical protein EV09_0594 [Prochlorococcus marinus str. SS35]KGG31751.1 hypothetical protein EV10_1848 [Prochlorococcus marinus str. SS51]
MGEARRRSKNDLGNQNPKNKHQVGKNDSPRIIDWLPLTVKQRNKFLEITVQGGWIGIGLLAVIWIVVRIVGPAAGWWVPADLH